jgi:serine/threonine protein kinase
LRVGADPYARLLDGLKTRRSQRPRRIRRPVIISPLMRVAVGERIGPYEVLGLLGAGGMGEVYRARDTRLNRAVAIKVITDNGTDPHAVRRFETEALSASALNHPNILTVHEFGLHEGLHFLVTEFVDGETLRERLRRGPVPVSDALEIAIQIATGLEGAHAAGLIHRDIKPENVMLRPDGYVKILDFGLAKLLPTANAASDTNTMSMRTTPGMLVGTIGYMAPEQVRGMTLDERVDVWSLGVVLHEMVTGQSPFQGPTTSDVIASILERQPPTLADTGVTAPPELEWILQKGLAKNRDQRYQTIREALIDLRRLKSQLNSGRESTGARSAVISSPSRMKRRALIAAMLLLGVIGVAGAVWEWTRSKSDTTSTVNPALPSRTIVYWLTVQRMREGKEYKDPFDSSGQEIFENDWRFWVNLQSEQPGVLYLLNEGIGKKGKTSLSWVYGTPPNQEAQAGRPVRTTASGFDEHPGLEHFWIVWSRERVPELERARRWSNETDLGEIKDPQEAAAIRDILAAHSSGLATESSKQTNRTVVTGHGEGLAVPIELQHK